jgi:hypothetical protein
MQTTDQPQRKGYRYDFFMAFWWTVGTEKKIYPTKNKIDPTEQT